MCDSVRRFAAGFVGVAAVLTFASASAFGQQPAPPANPNVYVNPFAAAGRFPNAAALGQPAAAPAVGRLGYGSLAPAASGGYGSLAASYANPSLGYGSLMNSNNGNGNNYGGYGMMGMMGMYGTQWMMNPYGGYEQGAASITRANAQYYQTIQQAKLTRQEAIRSSIQTRRAFIEEAEWEREHMPDPEKIRQKALERELSRARVSPPLTDVWSARSLNALLRYLIAQQAQGGKLPNVPLNEDTLGHINLTVGDSRGNVGLLKGGGELHWPLPLQGEVFNEGRNHLNTLMKTAYRSVESGNSPDSATIQDLRANLNKMQEALLANVDRLTPDEYIHANRYLRNVNDTLTALKDPKILNFFNKNWAPNARNVAELVQFMRDKGLWFAPATPKDEPAYVALYYALASFDAGMQRVARDSSDSDK